MKTLIAFFLLAAFSTNGQTAAEPTTVQGLTQTFNNYISDTNLLNAEAIALNGYSAAPEVNQKNIDKIAQWAYNPKMLNMFIANSIGTYVTSSKDVSLQDYYAVLESDEGVLFLGGNFSWGRTKKIDRLKNVTNIGFKALAKENFAELYKDGKVSPELGLNLKHTYFFRGSIKFDATQRASINNYRTSYLSKKHQPDLDKYSDVAPVAQHDENTELEARIKYITLSDTQKEELVRAKYNELYEAIAVDEEKFINDNKLYNSITASWVTFETYIPFTKKQYLLSPELTNPTTATEKFYNIRASITGTMMRKWSNKRTLYLTASGSVFNSNNIMANLLESQTFQDIMNQGTDNQVVTNTDEVYVGAFEKAVSQNLKAEFIYFIFKDIAGISASFDKTFGKFDSDNWKIGIPLSLKDGEGKPTVNFEFQWREVNKSHVVGISVGFVFGKFLN